MIILIHSSKTMKVDPKGAHKLSQPDLIDKAKQLNSYLETLSTVQLQKAMHLSRPLASKTALLIKDWESEPVKGTAAVDIFKGDIYSGLQVSDFSDSDLIYANETLRILSGLYGILKPLNGLYPYRLEMGYRLPSLKYKNLYKYWGDSIARTLPDSGLIINVSAEEYTKAVLPFIEPNRIITPKFLTKNAQTREPKFVVVHSKIARGAFANWLIKDRIDSENDMTRFNYLGYKFNKELSVPNGPVYVCDKFGGLGLSVRLK